MAEGKRASVDDRLDIREVIERYLDGVTRRDWKAVARCYAEEASFYELPPVEVRMNGRAEIIRRTSEMIESMKCMVMMMHSCVIEIEDDKARARTILQEVGRTLDGTADVIMYGYYEDELIKRDGSWQFTRRVFNPIHWQLPPDLNKQLGL